MQNPIESQDDDCEIIYHEPKLTRYDRAYLDRRKYQTERDAILANPVRSDSDTRRLLVLEHAIEKACAAMKRAEGDVSRRQEGIDEWRAGEGREVYNAKRRKRGMPNDDLSELTPEQKKQRKLDQTADSKWLDRRRNDGIPEHRIQAEFVARVQEREAKRAGRTEADAEEADMKKLPHYGQF